MLLSKLHNVHYACEWALYVLPVWLPSLCRFSLETIRRCFRDSLRCSRTEQAHWRSWNCLTLQLKGVFPRQCDNLIRKYWIHLFRGCSALVYPVKGRWAGLMEGVTSGQSPTDRASSLAKEPCCKLIEQEMVLMLLTWNNLTNSEFLALRCIHSYVSSKQCAGEGELHAEILLYGQHYFSALDNRVYFTEADLR